MAEGTHCCLLFTIITVLTVITVLTAPSKKGSWSRARGTGDREQGTENRGQGDGGRGTGYQSVYYMQLSLQMARFFTGLTLYSLYTLYRGLMLTHAFILLAFHFFPIKLSSFSALSTATSFMFIVEGLIEGFIEGFIEGTATDVLVTLGDSTEVDAL